MEYDNNQLANNPIKLEIAVIEELYKRMTDTQIKQSAIYKRFKRRARVYITDFFAKKGIKGLHITKPVFVEIKPVLRLYNYYELKERAEQYQEINPGSVLLFIFLKTEVGFLDNGSNDGNMIFLSLDNLKELPIINSNPPKPENVKLSYTPDELLDKAALCLYQNEVSLIVGTGISKDCGAPLWNELLQILFSENNNLKPLGETPEDYKNVVNACENSLLIMARYIFDSEMDDAKTELASKLRRIFYNKENILNKSSKSNKPAIREIAKLIGDCNNIKKVLSFNYDNFLEKELRKVSKIPKIEPEPVYKQGVINNQRFPIYHIHGYIGGENGDFGPYTKEITLSEQDYHNRYSDITHWANIELQYSLIRNVCFFIGLSMSDPNLRRIIDSVRKNDEKHELRHFLFLERKGLMDNEGNVDDDKNKKHWQRIEAMFNSMGINVIWFELGDNEKNRYENLSDKLEIIRLKYLKLIQNSKM